jgi:MFS transporter, NRE family, putaive nickel resistance protein
VPQVISEKEDFAPAISLSNGTWQLLGVLGPGLAGILAAWFGSQQIFFIDAATFIIAGILILLIPKQALATKTVSETEEKVTTTKTVGQKPEKVITIWQDILNGTKLLFQNRAARFALGVELAAAIAGAHILVNTIGYIEGGLHLSSNEYGWVMSAFGIGAAVAAFGIGILDRSRNKVTALLTGALLLVCAIAGANYVTILPLLLMWLFAGLGQSLCEMPSQILIAENISLEQQGKVYGAHFAWSHLWWAIAYPIAGFTGIHFKSHVFLLGAVLAFAVLLAVSFANLTYLRKRQFETV